jgi:ATP/maltotriose-dependent transcriptional regulator MalT/DNA-binding XRE family transcriptional regulator
MTNATHKSALLPESFTTFGELLKYLRRRARLTQQDLATAVGYSVAQVCRFEQNRWRPNQATIGALFIPALDLQNAPEYAARLLQLAAEPEARPRTITVTHTIEKEIVETVEDLGALEDVPAPPAHYVTRPEQLAQLQAQLALHRCLTLVGMAGVGKSSLAAALARDHDRPAFWLTLTTGVTASADAVARQLALFLFAHGQTRLEPILRERRDAPLSLAQKISLIGAGLQAMPALLCFDDAHLVANDEPVLQLLRHLTAATPARVLFISREEAPLPNVATLRLDGLPHDEACALIARLAPALEAPLVDRLARKTGGSPMLIRLAAGQLRGNAAKFITHLEQQPQVATYLLDTMLRNLSLHGTRLAALLAVFRQPIDLFDETLLESIHAVEGEFDQRRAVAELQRRHLIDRPDEAALHPLIHDHLYEALVADLPRRKRLHRIAGQWSETQGEIVEAAFHYFRAGRLKQAVDVIADQGTWLFSRGQGAAAAALIEDLLASARQRDPQPDVLRRLLTTHGDLLAFTVRAKEGETSLEQAAILAREADPKVRAEINLALGRIRTRRGHMTEALELFEASLTELPADDVWLRARLVTFSIAPLARLARTAEAERVAAEALRLTDQLAPLSPRYAAEVRCRIYYDLGVAKRSSQQRDEALFCWQRSLELSRQTRLHSLTNAALGNLGGIAFDRGDMLEALRQWQEATQGALTIGDSHAASVFLTNMAMIHRLRAEPEAARAKLEEAVSLARQMGDSVWVANAENLRATLLLDGGQAEEARQLVERLIEQTAKYSDARLSANLLDKLAMTQLACGQVAAAQATLRQALELPLVKNDVEYLLRFNLTVTVVHLMAGEFEQAAKLISPPGSNASTRIILERELVRAMLMLARGAVAEAHHVALTLAGQARAAGVFITAERAERLLHFSAPPPLTDLPRLMWM